MKTIQVDIPEKTADKLQSLVRDGWFTNEDEIVRAALMEFVSEQRLALIEQFQLEDIDWAISQKPTTE